MHIWENGSSESFLFCFFKLPNVTLLPCWRAKPWTPIWYCAVNLMTQIVTKTGIQRACKRSLTSYNGHKTLHEKLYLQQSSMVIIVPPLNFLLSSEQNFLFLLAFSSCNPLFFSEHLFRWKKISYLTFVYDHSTKSRSNPAADCVSLWKMEPDWASWHWWGKDKSLVTSPKQVKAP